MRTPVDLPLLHEAGRFRLRYLCADCAHFDEGPGLCAEGYPNGAHRDDRIESAPEITFCKSFELV